MNTPMGEAALRNNDRPNKERPAPGVRQPELSVIKGGRADVAENAVTILNVDEDAATALNHPEPTILKMRESVTLVPDYDDISTEPREKKQTKEAELTPPPPLPVVEAPKFDMATAVEQSTDPILDAKIDSWIAAEPGQENDAALAELGFLPTEAFRTVEGIKLQEEKDNAMLAEKAAAKAKEAAAFEMDAVEDTMAAARAFLKGNWRGLGDRLKKLTDNRNLRAWAGSTAFGVIGGFAVVGLTAGMFGDFQKNVEKTVKDYSSLQASR